MVLPEVLILGADAWAESINRAPRTTTKVTIHSAGLN